ncbi:hypothetical protein BP5796_10139 [Coleophoma crateriformis]|uniref:SGNH hydrolase-type esterase domain-containing protein n=1 Tax=Coleophoma crateriformis TaxID=565419 RepID=A0A3D8QUJ7_9HELO|nr:hypothetical protein BP5796_10139 [Coleophoma crateriformis]
MTFKKYPQFILFGDSITQFSSYLKDGYSFGAQLEEHCQRRLDVINRGLGGYNTANALSIIEQVIPPTSCAQVDYLLVAFGANDAVLPGFTAQHVPLQQYAKNIETIISHPLVKAHNPKILLVTPPPIDEVVRGRLDKAQGLKEVSRRQAVTREYARAIKKIVIDYQAKGLDIVLVDLWQAMMDKIAELTPGYVDDEQAGGKNLLGSEEKGENDVCKRFFYDGLHFTGAGYEVFYDTLVKHVGETWKDEPLDNPNYVFPPWSVAPKVE